MTAIVLVLLSVGAVVVIIKHFRDGGGDDSDCDHRGGRNKDECPGCGDEVSVCDECQRAPFHDCPDGYRDRIS